MPRAWYDPYGIFPSPKPHRRIRYRRPQSINRFDAIGGQSVESRSRLVEMASSTMDYLFSIDLAITDYIAAMGNEWSQAGGLFRPTAKILEWSMHGIPWLAAIIIAVFVTDSRVAAHLLINLFFGKLNSISLVCSTLSFDFL